jgi:hypothetical protein
MANVLSIALTVVGCLVLHAALLVWTALVLPRPVERARQRIESHPIRCFFVGLATLAATLPLMFLFFKFRDPLVVWTDNALQSLSDTLHVTRFYNDAWRLANALLWPLLAPAMTALILGGSAFAQLFAIRARPLMRDDRPLTGLAWGALCTASGYLVPFAGWFVFAPIVGLISIGAGLQALLSRAEPAKSKPRQDMERPQPVASGK